MFELQDAFAGELSEFEIPAVYISALKVKDPFPMRLPVLPLTCDEREKGRERDKSI